LVPSWINTIDIACEMQNTKDCLINHSKLFSDDKVYEGDQEEISNEEILLMEAYKSAKSGERFDELYDLTRLVYGMLRRTHSYDRIIPLLKDMCRDTGIGS
jgi:hypothetical protein